MKAGTKAVMGIERIGSAIGLTKSCSQRKLPISRPSGMAMAADQRNAWPIRHQLMKTLPSRSYSVQSRAKADTTPIGFGRENGGSLPHSVMANQKSTTTAQLAMANITRVRCETSRRIANSGELTVWPGWGTP